MYRNFSCNVERYCGHNSKSFLEACLVSTVIPMFVKAAKQPRKEVIGFLYLSTILYDYISYINASCAVPLRGIPFQRSAISFSAASRET